MSERYRGEYEDSEAARYDAEKAAHDDEMEQREVIALRASEAALAEKCKRLEKALREIADHDTDEPRKFARNALKEEHPRCRACGHVSPLQDGACGYCDSEGPCLCRALHFARRALADEEGK